MDGDYDKVGEGAGEGFNINIPWNGAGYGDYLEARKLVLKTSNDSSYGDPEYLLAFQTIVMPVAYEFSPQLVLVSAGFDAAVGDPLSGYSEEIKIFP